MKLSGYLKNSWGPENIAHITGYGDFQPTHVACDIEIKGKSVAKMTKVPRQTDDFRVFNTQTGDMAFEDQNQKENGIEEANEVEEENFDEFEELKKDFNKLAVNEMDG